jgi:hypothetical protein
MAGSVWVASVKLLDRIVAQDNDPDSSTVDGMVDSG